ncbi:unnamed protein product [Peronospora farinosa]|uniref:Uncharacterized protein n=1 Tax=Peronospora farinosa TaxID=134698 RepID=A0AAV0TCC1_9STRA|nr:unnamed protein product [Peronospora farinosa]
MAEKFATHQMHMQAQLQHIVKAQHAPAQQPRMFVTSFEHGSNTFGDYLKARGKSMRMGSLYELMERKPMPIPQQQAWTFCTPQDFGLKMPKMKDMDWPGFPRFSDNEIYAGVGADF